MKTALQHAWDDRMKLCAKGDKLHAEGDLLFVNAVIAESGDTTIKWGDGICTLGTGEVFGGQR